MSRFSVILAVVLMLATPSMSNADYSCTTSITHIVIRFNSILQVYFGDYDSQIGICALDQPESGPRTPSYFSPKVCQSIYGLMLAALHAESKVTISIKGDGECTLGNTLETSSKVYTVMGSGFKPE